MGRERPTIQRQAQYDAPAELGRQLSTFERRAQQAIEQTSRLKTDAPAPTQTKRIAYTPQLGEFVKYDPTGGTFTITLPRVTPADAAKLIFFRNISTSATAITIRTVGAAQVNGGSSMSLSGSGAAAILITDGKDWWSL